MGRYAAAAAHLADALVLAEARGILEPLEARPALVRADARAARLAAPAAYPAGLTAREVEALRLVVHGLTDARVAAYLSLATRTVGQHLRSVYNKLGAGRYVDRHAFLPTVPHRRSGVRRVRGQSPAWAAEICGRMRLLMRKAREGAGRLREAAPPGR